MDGQWEANLHSLFCFATGEVQADDDKCASCKGKKTYPACVKLDPANGGDAVGRETRRESHPPPRPLFPTRVSLQVAIR